MDCLSSGFADVDHARDPSFFSSCLATLNTLPYFQEYKTKSFSLMDVCEGSRVLEVGCGLGYDALALAEMVGQKGRVVAVDCSRSMLHAARSLAGGFAPSLEFILADAARLPCEDGCFDCARVDRTLQHTPQPQRVVAEMARATKSGGHIVAYEPDWGTFAVGSGDRRAARIIADQWCDSFLSGWAGRQLRRLFLDAGLTDIEVLPSTLVITDLLLAEKVFDLSGSARRAADLLLLSRSEAEGWLEELKGDDLAGRFFSSYTGFLACGRKP